MEYVILGGTTHPQNHWHHLSRWWSRECSAGEVPEAGALFDRHERIVALEPPGKPLAHGPFERVARAIMAYRIFPPHLGVALVRRSPVQIGDAVGLRYHLVPGLNLVFASRVVEVIEEPLRRGFTYRTLQGHPEQGEETFSVTKDAATGAVRAALNSWSRPGTLLTRLTYPMARHLQLSAGRAALDHLERIAH